MTQENKSAGQDVPAAEQAVYPDPTTSVVVDAIVGIGTAGRVPVFHDGNTIKDSPIADSGSALSIPDRTLSVGGKTVALLGSGGTAGRLAAFDGSGNIVSGATADTDLTALQATVESIPATVQLVYRKDAADGSAGAATSERAIAVLPAVATTITSISFIPDAALTRNADDFATLTVRSGSGGLTVLAEIATALTGPEWTALEAIDFGTVAHATQLAGVLLTFEITKTGSGVVVPSGLLIVQTLPS